MDSPQNVISFCTGYGGLELGLRRAGVDIRPVCYIDREAYVQAVLIKEIEEGRLAPAPIWSDIATFDASSFRGKVDGVTCGYPCQPFSTAGKRLGEKDPRHLWQNTRTHQHNWSSMGFRRKCLRTPLAWTPHSLQRSGRRWLQSGSRNIQRGGVPR